MCEKQNIREQNGDTIQMDKQEESPKNLETDIDDLKKLMEKWEHWKMKIWENNYERID